MSDATSAGQSANSTANPAPGFVDHPDHSIEIAESPTRCRAFFGDLEVADSENALVVQESNYAPVIYFPRGDVDFTLLAASDHASYCPFKGDASYWSIAGGDGKNRGENAAWSYQTPYDEMAALKGHIAFYADRVRVVS